MLAARAQAIKHLKQQHPFVEEGHLLSKLMGYCSKEAHSCVEKAAMISFVKLRILEPDEKGSLRADTLIKVCERTIMLIHLFNSNNSSLGYGRGWIARPGAIFRIDHAGHHWRVCVWCTGRDWHRLATFPKCLAACGCCLRGQRFHLSRTEIFAEGTRDIFYSKLPFLSF